MKIDMEFESQMCTNMEQSERLLALGLNAETADMCYQVKFFDPFPQHLVDCTPSLLTHPPINDERFVPAWSLHRLIEIAGIRAFSPVSSLHGWYDDIIAQIQSLIHIGYIDEKYLDMDVVNKREEKNMELLKNN
jgi:hypothetical protein